MAISKKLPLARADQQRVAQINAQWQAYYGVFPKQLKNRPRGGSDTITTNRCKAITEKGASFLFGQDLRLEVGQDAPTGAQDWLDAFWKANRQMTTLQKLALTGGVTGHAALKVVPRVPYPRLIVIDPSILSVSHTPGDIEDVTDYRLTYEVQLDDGTAGYRREVISRDTPVSWTIAQQQGNGSPDDWTTTDVQSWNYPYPPIVEGQNLPAPSEYWGLSDIGPDLIQLNTDINFVLSNISRIIRLHASPLLVGKGFQANQLDHAADGMMLLPSKDADISILAAPNDLASSLAFAHELSSRMDEISRIPSLSLGLLGDVPKGQISGLALQIMYQPLIEKTNLKRRLYGDLLEELCRRALDMAGFGSGIEITIHWPALLPTDDVQEAQAAQTWLNVGASRDTLLQRGGFDPALEAQKNGVAAAASSIAPDPEPSQQADVLSNERSVDPSTQSGAQLVAALRL